MSYGFRIAGDARADMQALEPWLQEEVLDEVELLAGSPSVLPIVSEGEDLIYAFSRRSGAVVHYVAMTLSRNDSTRTLMVLGILHRVLPIPPDRT